MYGIVPIILVACRQRRDVPFVLSAAPLYMRGKSADFTFIRARVNLTWILNLAFFGVRHRIDLVCACPSRRDVPS